MAPRLTSQMCFLLKSNTRWTQDEERSRVTGNLNTKKPQLYQRTRLIGEYTQSGRREEQSEGEGGKGGKNKKEKGGEKEAGRSCLGPLFTFITHNEDGWGAFAVPNTSAMRDPTHTFSEPRDTEQARAASMICANTRTLAGYANNSPK